MPIIFIPLGGAESAVTSTSVTPFSDLYNERLSIELGTDDSTALFTTARRKAAINEGVAQFADLTECLTRQSTIVSSHAVGEYNLLSTAFIGAGLVRLAKQRPEYQLVSSGASPTAIYVSGDSFERRDVEWLNQYEPGWRQSTAGTPRYWYERRDGGKRYFGLVPPPEIGSSQTGKALVNYIARAEVMTADSDVAFTVASQVRTDLEPYVQASVHFAAHRLEKLRVNTEASQMQLQTFLGWVERYLRDQTPKGGQTFKHSRSYFSEVRNRRGGMDSLPRPMPGWNY